MPEPLASPSGPRSDDAAYHDAPARSESTAPPPTWTTSPAEPAASPLAGNSTAQLTWLHEELGRELATYRRRRKRDKRKAFILQMATVTLSATITVLLGLRVPGAIQQRFADGALVLGAIITVLAAAEAFFSHRSLWTLRTETVRHLEALTRHVDYYRAGLNGRAPNPATVQHYLTDLENILTTDHTAWQHLRATYASYTSSSDSDDTRPANVSPPLTHSRSDALTPTNAGFPYSDSSAHDPHDQDPGTRQP